jgi:AAA+ superfamily predicted ATPase
VPVFQEELYTNIKANIPVISVITYEWQRLHGFCVGGANENERHLYRWSYTSGLYKWNSDTTQFDKEEEGIKDPLDIIEWFNNAEKRQLILLLEDFHPFLTEQNFQIVRALRETTRIDTALEKTLIVQTPTRVTLTELQKEIPCLELDLPDDGILQTILNSCVEDLEYDAKPRDEEIAEIAAASLGMSSVEAEWTFKRIIADKERLTSAEIPLVIQEKEQIIKKEGILEYFHPKGNFNQVGGLENLKEWLKNRGKAFTADAKKYGITSPKGVMLLGVPGCGKSLVSKTISNEWNLPLLKFDLGKVFGGIVGESESNIRKALALAETIAPSILWIDEIEKGLSGLGSNGDSGTSSRVFGTLLTWMQEKESEVFVIATANNIEQLPPELLRKGRFDEIFFVDLPAKQERKAIFSIHIQNRDRDIEDYDMERLLDKSQGMSGAEIEEAINEGLYLSYSDESATELETRHIVQALDATYPLSKTMGTTINALRKWSELRARAASSGEREAIETTKDETIPTLRQEKQNPFID